MTNQNAIQTLPAKEVHSNQSFPQTTGESQAEQWSYVPPIDILESSEAYIVEFDAPGLNANEIDLAFERGILKLHAPVTARQPQEVTYLRQEYGIGAFDRSVQLGQLASGINGDHVSASYECGVLTVTLPKNPAAIGRKISVKSN